MIFALKVNDCTQSASLVFSRNVQEHFCKNKIYEESMLCKKIKEKSLSLFFTLRITWLSSANFLLEPLNFI